MKTKRPVLVLFQQQPHSDTGTPGDNVLHRIHLLTYIEVGIPHVGKFSEQYTKGTNFERGANSLLDCPLHQQR